MKRCKNITAWIDYPFKALGDIAYQKAPVRRVRVLSYDQNKHARIEVLGYGYVTEIKAGYLYSTPAPYDSARKMNRRKIERMIPSL